MSVIEVQNLSKRYGDRFAVQDVSFAIEKGEIFGLIGPNGAGKTTLVETIAGLRRPDAGWIRVNGLNPLEDRDALRQILGIQLQDSQLPDKIKVWEAMELYSTFYKNPVDWQGILASLGLWEKREAAFEKLSGGQKQRLSIGLALVGSPAILILDELTTGLDPQARRNIWQYIKDMSARGVTILVVSHFMVEAEQLCDHLAMMNAGRIVALDTPSGIIAAAEREQKVCFRPSSPLDERIFSNLPEVRQVSQKGSQVVVTGTGNLVQVVISVLARSQIVAYDLRIETVGLEEAFIELAQKDPLPAPNRKQV